MVSTNGFKRTSQHMVSRNRWKLIHDGPEISSEATPSRSKIEPESTRDRPEASWAPPGGPQAEKARKCYFWRKRESQGDPFWNRFCIVSLYETNKARDWRCSDNKDACERSSVFDWKVLKNIAKRCPRRASGEIGPSATYLCKTKKIKSFSRGDLVALTTNFAFPPP